VSRGNDVIRIVSANFGYGGPGPDGGEDRWHVMTAFLRDESPDIVLCQEIRGSKPGGAGEHLLAAARQAGMTLVVLGPPAPGAASDCYGSRTAILARPEVAALDRGPAGRVPWDALPWRDALLEVPGIPCPVRFYSVRLPHSSSVWQLDFASRLATRIAERREAGEAAIAGGDWNCLSPADDYTLADLATSMPVRVRPARIRYGPHGMKPNYDVHYVLTAVGLEDVATFLRPEQRQPPDLTPSGTAGGRVDRVLLTPELAPDASSYRQVRTGASDHDSIVVTLTPSWAA
jgi:endonuclease/exonuclease/phosphatase family metal-dependent hydrolase